MLRVLIADQSDLLVKLLAEQLEKEFEVKTCVTGHEALKLVGSFNPHIVVLEVTLSDLDGITVLHTLHAADHCPNIVALTYMTNERALLHLNRYDIDCVLPKPCTVELVMDQVRSIGYRICNPLNTEYPLQYRIDALLMSLGFRVGMNRYSCIVFAILARYNNPDCAMKELYIDVARKLNCTAQSVEKAIRDGINRAYKRGNHDTWAYYFRTSVENGKPCKGNSDFLARIVACLRRNQEN